MSGYKESMAIEKINRHIWITIRAEDRLVAGLLVKPRLAFTHEVAGLSLDLEGLEPVVSCPFMVFRATSLTAITFLSLREGERVEGAPWLRGKLPDAGSGRFSI